MKTVGFILISPFIIAGALWCCIKVGFETGQAFARALL